MANEVRLTGYRELLRACADAEKDTKRFVRGTFREVGEVIRVPWRGGLARYGRKTETGLRTIVRQRGVSVEQTRRRSGVEARRRPNFTRLQQGLGDAVLDREGNRIEGRFIDAIDKVADHFER